MSCKRKNDKETEEKTSTPNPCSGSQGKEDEVCCKTHRDKLTQNVENRCQSKRTNSDAPADSLPQLIPNTKKCTAVPLRTPNCNKLHQNDSHNPLGSCRSGNINKKVNVIPRESQERGIHKCHGILDIHPQSGPKVTPKLEILPTSKPTLEPNRKSAFEKQPKQRIADTVTKPLSTRNALTTKYESEITLKAKEEPKSETEPNITHKSKTPCDSETTHELKLKLMVVTKIKATRHESIPESKTISKSHSFEMQRALNFSLFNLIFVCFMFVCFVLVWIFINFIFILSCFYQFCTLVFKFFFIPKPKPKPETEATPENEEPTGTVAETQTQREFERAHALQMKLVFTTKVESKFKHNTEIVCKSDSDTESNDITRPKRENVSKSSQFQSEHESTTIPKTILVSDGTSGGAPKFKSEIRYESKSRTPEATPESNVPKPEASNEPEMKSVFPTIAESELPSAFLITQKPNTIKITPESEITRNSQILPEIAPDRELNMGREAESDTKANSVPTPGTEIVTQFGALTKYVTPPSETISTYETKPEFKITPDSLVIPATSHQSKVKPETEETPESEAPLKSRVKPDSINESQTKFNVIAEYETTSESETKRISETTSGCEVAGKSTKKPESVNESQSKCEIIVETTIQATTNENPPASESPCESKVKPGSTDELTTETEISNITSNVARPDPPYQSKVEKSHKSDIVDESKLESITESETLPVPQSKITSEYEHAPESEMMHIFKTFAESATEHESKVTPETVGVFESKIKSKSKGAAATSTSHQSKVKPETVDTPESEPPLKSRVKPDSINESQTKFKVTAEYETTSESETKRISETTSGCEVAGKLTEKSGSVNESQSYEPKVKPGSTHELTTKSEITTETEISNITSFVARSDAPYQSKVEKSHKSDIVDKSNLESQSKRLVQSITESEPLPVPKSKIASEYEHALESEMMHIFKTFSECATEHGSKDTPETVSVFESKIATEFNTKLEPNNTSENEITAQRTHNSKTVPESDSRLLVTITPAIELKHTLKSTPESTAKTVAKERIRALETTSESHSSLVSEKTSGNKLQSKGKSESYKLKKQTIPEIKPKQESKRDSATQTDPDAKCVKQETTSESESQHQTDIIPTPRLRNEYETILMKKKESEVCSCQSTTVQKSPY